MSDALIDLKVTKMDGTSAEYAVLPVVVMAAERHFKTGIGTLMEDLHIEYLLFLAWKQEHFTGGVVQPFDEWCNTVANIRIINDEEPAPLDATA